MSVYPGQGNLIRSSPRRGSRIAPLLLGGTLAAIALAGWTRVGAWLRGFFSVHYEDAALLPLRIDDERSLFLLRESILGRAKSDVAAACGFPRSAAFAGGQIADGPYSDYWHADIWYYPLDARSHIAMAVQFRGGSARVVDFFDAPSAL
jgi:hypothetical protein